MHYMFVNVLDYDYGIAYCSRESTLLHCIHEPTFLAVMHKGDNMTFVMGPVSQSARSLDRPLSSSC